MKPRPLILVSPSTQREGVEFADASISLSNRYFEAVLAGGGLPLALPCVADKRSVAEYVARADGVLLTGGEDIQPRLYAPDIDPALAAKAGPAEPERDLLELSLIDEVFRQRKPLLAICRGHQMLNVALGGTLIVDIPAQVPGALNHRRMDARCEPVHSVALTPESDLARFVRRRELRVNSTHHQAIDRISDLLVPVARSEDGIIEAMELKDKRQLPFLLSVQFHPERLFDRYTEFTRLFAGFVRVSAGVVPDKL